DDVVIDYQPRGDATTGEKRALVIALKKEVLRAVQLFAQAAGLKLLGIAPRAFAAVAAMRAASPAPDPTTATAALLIGPAGGEFVVARGEQLLFSRAVAAPSLVTDAALMGEVRRNLAVYNSQSPQWPV